MNQLYNLIENNIWILLEYQAEDIGILSKYVSEIKFKA